MDYVDMTGNVTGFVNWANVAPFEPERRERPRSEVREIQTQISGATDFFDAVKGPGAPTAKLSKDRRANSFTTLTSDISESKSTMSSKALVTEATEIDRIAKQRVRLMAAKYVSGKESPEMVARLEILNSRLLDRSPRVTVAHVQSLESAANQLAQARAAREERMRRLGIEI